MTPAVQNATGSVRIGVWARERLASGWRPTISEFTEAALSEPDLIDDEYRALALERALRSDLRQIARTTHDGLPFALSVTRLVDGEPRREFAALSIFEARDYDNALAAARKRVSQHVARYQSLAKRANEEAGVQLVLPVVRWVSASQAKAA